MDSMLLKLLQRPEIAGNEVPKPSRDVSNASKVKNEDNFERALDRVEKSYYNKPSADNRNENRSNKFSESVNTESQRSRVSQDTHESRDTQESSSFVNTNNSTSASSNTNISEREVPASGSDLLTLAQEFQEDVLDGTINLASGVINNGEAAETFGDLLQNGKALYHLGSSPVNKEVVAQSVKNEQSSVIPNNLSNQGLVNLTELQAIPSVQEVVDNKDIVAASLGKENIVQSIAGGIIDVAQNLSAKPELSEGKILTSQVDQLLNIGNNSTQNKTASAIDKAFNTAFFEADANEASVIDASKQGNIAKNINDLAQNIQQSAISSNNPSIIQNQQNSLTNKNQPQNILNDQLSGNNSELASNDVDPAKINQAILDAKGKGQANQNSLSDKPSFSQLAAVDNGLNNSQNTLTPSSISFDKLTTSIDQLNKDVGSHRLANPKDVLAQIKFGVNQAAQNGNKQVTVQLYPKELGNVDIHMETTKEGKTHVKVMAERTDTMNLMQKEADNLRQILQDSLKTDSSQLSFSFHDKSQDDWRQLANQFDANGIAGENEEDDGQVASLDNYGAYVVSNQGVDIRV